MAVDSAISRRGVMAGLGGAAVVAVVAESGAQAARVQLELANADYTQWASQIGSNFTAHTRQVLRLVEVRPYGNASRAGPRPAGVRDPGFLACFDVVRGGAMAAGRYLVAHPVGGTFEMFLTNAGPNLPLRMLAEFN